MLKVTAFLVETGIRVFQTNSNPGKSNIEKKPASARKNVPLMYFRNRIAATMSMAPARIITIKKTPRGKYEYRP